MIGGVNSGKFKLKVDNRGLCVGRKEQRQDEPQGHRPS